MVEQSTGLEYCIGNDHVLCVCFYKINNEALAFKRATVSFFQ